MRDCKNVQVYDACIRIAYILVGGDSIAFALVGQTAKYTRDNVYPLAGARGRSCIMLIQCKSSRDLREESKAEAAPQSRIVTTEYSMYVRACVCVYACMRALLRLSNISICLGRYFRLENRHCYLCYQQNKQ